jgi:hypothetical protein
MNKKLLVSVILCVFIFLLGILAKETDTEQKQADVDKTKIVEEWQTNPEAFVKLFYGDDLSKRSPRKEMTRLGEKLITDKVIGSHVEWPVTFGISPVWLALGEELNRKFGTDNLGLFYIIGPDFSGWMDLEDSSRHEGTKEITWKQMTWGIPPQSSVLVKMKIEWASASIWKNGMLMIYVRGSEVEIETSFKKCDWPEYNSEIYASPVIGNFPVINSYEVRVTSELEFPIKVGLRSDDKGIDFIVPKKGAASIRVPSGKYDIYFQYAADPESLYQGDSFNVENSGVGIQLKRTEAGGYKLRKIK